MRYIVSLLICLFLAMHSYAQSVMPLPVDPAVVRGELPNGMTYYVATNPSVKGMADFALVQKTGASVVGNAQQCLGAQDRILSPSVQTYFINSGSTPGRKGFVETTDKASIFKFQDVLLTRTPTVLDSTLLVLMGMVEQADWCAPADHALLVAGDVDAKAVADKLRMLSFMIPAAQSDCVGGYEWVEQEGICVRRMPSQSSEVATVAATWRFKRTPKELANTIQPAVFNRFMTELGIVAQDRIRKVLKSEGIPYADVSFRYIDSVKSLKDETFTISVSVSPSELKTAVSVLSSVMASMDSECALESEVRHADQIFLTGIRNAQKRMETNSEYINRCVSAYIYNSPLVSRKDLLAFHTSRELKDDVRLKMFNNIISNAIDDTRNLVLEFMTDGVESSEEIKDIFVSAWNPGKYAVAQQPSSEGAPALSGPSEQMKVKKNQKEHMSGGKMWTLENGLKVIIKNMPSDGYIRYSLLLNGGYANVPDLKQGEGAYFSDILSLSKIGGVSAEKFMDVARQSGVTIDFNVDLSSTSFYGTVADDRFECLLPLLQTMLNDRQIDKNVLDYHIECELLREAYLSGSEREKMGEISHIMFPDYIHTPIREASSLSLEFAQKADKFMEVQSAKVNDGVLILVGDVDEKVLKKALQMYARGFRTADRTFTKPVVSYQPIAGTATRSVLGSASEIDVVMSAPLSLTAENYYAASVASMVMRKALAMELSSSGMSLMVRYDCRRSPQGRYNLFIRLGEANPEGYAPDSVHGNQLTALESVRNFLGNVESLEVKPEELNIYKAILKKRVNDMKSTPEYWVRAISMRYTDGKDFTNGSDGWIDSVTPAKVKSLLSSLANGTRVEYLTIRK